MISNPITFIIDANGSQLITPIGQVRALNGDREFIRVITPMPNTSALSVNILTRNSVDDLATQYVLASTLKGMDVLPTDHPQYQLVADWNVRQVELKQDSVATISKYRSGSIDVSFQFSEISASAYCVNYIRKFGINNPLPLTSNVGDYYECEDYDYTINSPQQYRFSKGMLAYWNGDRFVKDRLKPTLSCEPVRVAVSPSFGVGYELEPDEVNYLDPLSADIVSNSNRLQVVETEIIDLPNKYLEKLGGTMGGNINMGGNGIKNASKGVLENDLATIKNIDEHDVDVLAHADIRQAIVDVADEMNDDYETKADANLHKARTTDLETFKNVTVPTTYETKVNATAERALKVDKITKIIGLDLENDITISEFRIALGNASQVVAGLMSVEDKIEFDNLMLLFETDGDNIVNTIAEILAIFQNYPEGEDLVTILASKVDKVAGKQLSTNDLTNVLKDNYDTAYNHSQVLDLNPHKTKYAQLEDKPTTLVDLGVLDLYDKNYIDALKDKNGWKSELLGTLSNNGTIALSIINQYDEIQMYAKDTLGVIDNENIRPSLMQSGDSVYFFDDTQAFIMVDTLFGFYAPVGYTLQVVGIKYTELKAVETTYDNTTSGRTSTDVQGALDEAFSEIDTKFSKTTETIMYGNVLSSGTFSSQNNVVHIFNQTTSNGYVKKINARVKTSGVGQILAYKKNADDTLSFYKNLCDINFEIGDYSKVIDVYVEKNLYLGFVSSTAIIYYTGGGDSLRIPYSDRYSNNIIATQVDAILDLNLEINVFGGFNLNEELNIKKQTKELEIFSINGIITNDFYNDGGWVDNLSPTVENSIMYYNKPTTFEKWKCTLNIMPRDLNVKLVMVTKTQPSYTNGMLYVTYDFVNKKISIHKSWDGNALTTPDVLVEDTFTFDVIVGKTYQLSLERDTAHTIIASITYLDSPTSTILEQIVIRHTNIGDSNAHGNSVDGVGIIHKTGSYYRNEFSMCVVGNPNPHLMIIGDSYVEGWSLASSGNNKYAKLIQDAFVTGNTLINCRGGETSIGVVERLNTDFRLIKPNYVLIAIGFNDAFLEATTINQYRENIMRIANHFINMGSIPILTTVPNVNTANTMYESINNWVKTESNLKYVDFKAVLSNNDGSINTSLFFTSDVHPNSTGHLKMFERFKKDCSFVFDYSDGKYQEPVIPITEFTNSWVARPGYLVGYTKDYTGRIQLYGLIQSGVVGQSAFRLPQEYRPNYTKSIAVVSNNAFGIVSVLANGNVVISSGNNAWVSIDGISFYNGK